VYLGVPYAFYEIGLLLIKKKHIDTPLKPKV
jgi:hypothetical protein